MSGRGVSIGEAARLSLRHSCLCVEKQGQEAATVPLEDISFLVLDTQQVTLSGSLLAGYWSGKPIADKPRETVKEN